MNTRMSKTAKVAISLPQDLLKGIERERRARGESRSEFFRRAVEAFLRQKRERELDEQYVRAYREMPETPEEIEWVQTTGLAAFAESPWEESGEE